MLNTTDESTKATFESMDSFKEYILTEGYVKKDGGRPVMMVNNRWYYANGTRASNPTQDSTFDASEWYPCSKE